MNITNISDLIEHLKGSQPYGKTETFKLWEALTILSNQQVQLNKFIKDNLLEDIEEIPRGTINGVNKLFFLTFKPKTTFIMGYKNGDLLLDGTDYTIQDTRIMFTVAPAALSVIQFMYQIRRDV